MCEIMPDCVMLGMLKLAYNILGETKKCQKRDFGLIDRLVLINQGK